MVNKRSMRGSGDKDVGMTEYFYALLVLISGLLAYMTKNPKIKLLGELLVLGVIFLAFINTAPALGSAVLTLGASLMLTSFQTSLGPRKKGFHLRKRLMAEKAGLAVIGGMLLFAAYPTLTSAVEGRGYFILGERDYANIFLVLFLAGVFFQGGARWKK